MSPNCASGAHQGSRLDFEAFVHFLAEMQVKTGDQNFVTDRVLPLMSQTEGDISELAEVAQTEYMVEFTKLL